MYCWHLRRLASDLRFWGYVQIRTESLSENRSFAGEFPPDVWTTAWSLISSIRAFGMAGVAQSKFSEGALLEGDARDGTLLIGCSAADAAISEGDRAFYDLVDLVRPYVASAAALDDSA